MASFGVIVCLVMLAAMMLSSTAAPTAPYYGGNYGGYGHGGGGHGQYGYGGGNRLFNRNRLNQDYGHHGGAGKYSDDHGVNYRNHGGLDSGVSHGDSQLYGGKNSRNRGNVNDGFSKVYHKEEYARSNDFYDNSHDDDHQQRYGNYDNRHKQHYGGYNDDYRHAGGQKGGFDGYGKQYYDKSYDDVGDKYGSYGQHGYNKQGYGHY